MWQYHITQFKAAVALFGALGVTASAMAQEKFSAKLDGIKEVPVCSSVGSGKFEATVSQDKTTIDFTLNYDNFDGVVSVAHIHLGKPTEAGGIIAFLCGGGGKDTCPEAPGTVTGTVVAEDVIGPVDQGIAEGEFDEFLRGLQRGLTYVNVHSDICPGGEVRGQVVKGGRVVSP